MTDDGIRSRPFPNCVLCGLEGETLYAGLTDPLYDAPGVWNLKRCPECGLIWLDPMPRAEDLGKAYRACYYTHSDVGRRRRRFAGLYEAIENGYLRSRLGYSKGVGPAWWGVLSPLARLYVSGRSCVESSAMYLRAHPGGKLLEIGFGDGSMLARLRDLGWDVEGLDVDSVCVDAARERGLTVRQGDLAGQDYPDESFDCVIMRHVQEHVPEPLEFLRECRRILKSGGTLVSVMPNAASWEHRRFGSEWVALEPPRHLFLFGPESLKRAAVMSGFSINRLFSNANTAWASWIRNVMLRPERFWAKWAPRKIGALRWHFALRARMIFDRWAGQEIVVIARKL